MDNNNITFTCTFTYMYANPAFGCHMK